MTATGQGEADTRFQALCAWAGAALGEPVAPVPASADASFRRYFRCQVAGRSVILMDAPPAQEDSAPFVDIAGRLTRAGVPVPEILALDLSRGFMALSDLGRETWLTALTPENADAWFSQALDTLITLQQADTGGLPVYDDALLRRELALFPDWYLGRHLHAADDPRLMSVLTTLNDQLVEAALAQRQVFVHRDYMPRNLMVSTPNPGVLDFQDAVRGPVSYDPVCLFRDAFISWPESRVLGWLADYHGRALSAGLPVPAERDAFLRDADLMGAQRHLKVIGIFARIRYRDGKPRYLDDAPRFFAYLQAVATRHPELEALRRLLALLAEREG
ncbi:aminoglycoside phosphotransferase family protein [Isoalcanivorax indicus]|uniref:aminoglycoside phosphotransferase family protein n=1 Tax=Isoalcanivorax indicus TaxID=2202653 RepID=UPI000DB9CF43|nr:phosphotransferase [Isoalcanivorax indicus]